MKAKGILPGPLVLGATPHVPTIAISSGERDPPADLRACDIVDSLGLSRTS